MKNILLIVLSVSFTAAAQILMRRGMLQIGVVSWNGGAILRMLSAMVSNIFLWLAFLCYGFSIIIWMLVLSRVAVSFAYAFSSLGYVLVTVMGALILKESISVTKIIGIAVVCTGLMLITKG